MSSSGTQQKPKYDVYISYRRNGGFETAKFVSLSLRERGYRVFFDFEEMRSGSFNGQLDDAIGSASDFVLILSKDALERCSNEGDWLRKEIEYALKSHKNIIPLMLNDFEWPVSLPAGLEGLQYMNGVLVSQEYFDAMMDHLAKRLKSSPAGRSADKKKESFIRRLIRSITGN